MKKDFLIKLEISEEQTKSILDIYNKDIDKYTDISINAKNELDSLKKDLVDLKVKNKELQSRYNTDIKELNSKLTKKDYDYAVDNLLSSHNFSSELAKKAVL